MIYPLLMLYLDPRHPPCSVPPGRHAYRPFQGPGVARHEAPPSLIRHQVRAGFNLAFITVQKISVAESRSCSSRFHGYPSQVLEDQARAFGRLVEDKLSPALLASQPSTMNLRKLTPLLSTPPPLLTGLISPLPSISSLRRFDVDALKREGVTAVKALSARLREDQEGRGWLLGCRYVVGFV